RPSSEAYLELLRRELAGDLDAIVIDRSFVQASSRHGSERFAGVSLPVDVLAMLAHRVAAGTGLLLFTHGDVPPQWEALGLKPCSKPALKPGRLSIATPHYTTIGVPLTTFSHLRLPVYTTSNRPLLQAGRNVFMSTTENALERILVLGHSSNGMVPAAADGSDYSHCDNYFAFLARCLVWLSRREGEIRLQEWRVQPATIKRLGATPVTATIKLRTTGPAANLQLQVRVRAADGRIRAEQYAALTLPTDDAAEHRFTLPNGLPAGRYFADLIVRAGEEVIEWGTAPFEVQAPVRIASVSPNNTVLPAGRAIRGTVELTGGRSAATALHSVGLPEATTAGQVTFVDGHAGSALLPGTGALFYAAEGNLNVSTGSVEMWVALGEPQPGESGTMTNWWWRTPQALRVLHYPDRGQVSFQVRSATEAGIKSANISFSVADWAAGEWHHAVWTWEQAGLKVYIDGQLAGKSKPSPMPTIVRGPLRVGHCQKYAPTSARIDEFRVYGRALSPEEVEARAVSVSLEIENNLLLHLPFDVSEAPQAGPCRLHLALHDRRNRVVSETWLDLGTGETQGIPFRFPYNAPVARSARVVARLLDKDGVIDEMRSPWVELAENGLDDFLYFCWDWAYSRRHPDYMRDAFFRRIWEQGIDGTDGSSSLDFKLVAGAPFPGGKRNSVEGRPWYDVFNELKGNYTRTGDTKYLIRQPCLSDPATWADYRERVARKVLPMRAHKPVGYGLGDENTITFESSPLDFCFSPHCLREFRAWLKKEYSTLDQLNRTWKTTFAAWDKVVPMTTDQVATHGSFAPWADHRAFMETVFAKAYERAAEAVHAIDPDARLSTSGT
ncbi:MAG: beta-galactosidase, partial [Planctomycetes bacterium]|nr:beta-galactosidase [Planctomycetota bacterium]